MAKLVYDINELFQTYFNVSVGGYIVPAENNSYVADRYVVQQIEQYKSSKTDKFGRPYFMPLTVGGVFLPVARIIINSKKRIITTPVTGRHGTVKEFIGFEDYIITVQGFMFSDEPLYPEDDVQNLIELYEKNEPLEVENELINYVTGGMKVIIQSLNLPQTKHINVQPFTMRLITDDEFEAILEE